MITTNNRFNTMPEQVQENMDNINKLDKKYGSLNNKLVFVGEWLKGRKYLPQQVVSYGGSSYVCISTVYAILPPPNDTTHFKLFIEEGATGPQGPQGETGPQGPQGPAGAVNVDNAFSTTSENAVQNKIITNKINEIDTNAIYLAQRITQCENENAQQDTHLNELDSRDYIVEQGNDYVRWANGWQICVGNFDQSGSVTVNFPKPFLNGTSYSVCITGVTNSTNTASVRTYSAQTKESTYFVTGGLSITLPANYIAIGKWK